MGVVHRMNILICPPDIFLAFRPFRNILHVYFWTFILLVATVEKWKDKMCVLFFNDVKI